MISVDPVLSGGGGYSMELYSRSFYHGFYTRWPIRDSHLELSNDYRGVAFYLGHMRRCHLWWLISEYRGLISWVVALKQTYLQELQVIAKNDELKQSNTIPPHPHLAPPVFVLRTNIKVTSTWYLAPCLEDSASELPVLDCARANQITRYKLCIISKNSLLIVLKKWLDRAGWCLQASLRNMLTRIMTSCNEAQKLTCENSCNIDLSTQHLSKHNQCKVCKATMTFGGMVW